MHMYIGIRPLKDQNKIDLYLPLYVDHFRDITTIFKLPIIFYLVKNTTLQMFVYNFKVGTEALSRFELESLVTSETTLLVNLSLVCSEPQHLTVPDIQNCRDVGHNIPQHQLNQVLLLFLYRVNQSSRSVKSRSISV